jgi:leucyl aminopeptidase
VGIEVIRGEELVARGLNGIYGVGKSATHPACLVHLSYVPPVAAGAEPSSVAAKSICLVGKGITYDTGGLSLKTKEGMPGMKTDMGGSAGVLCAFRSLVLDGAHLASATPTPIHALLCIAENGIGPNATRPDDIHVMYSGKTVEINNTDAEGRLVLSDGCAFAAKHLNPEIIIDMATLTGLPLPPLCLGLTLDQVLKALPQERNMAPCIAPMKSWRDTLSRWADSVATLLILSVPSLPLLYHLISPSVPPSAAPLLSRILRS